MSELMDVTASLEAVTLASGPRLGPRLAITLRRYLPALIVFVLFIVLWEAAVAVFQIEKFLLPRPSVIVVTFWRELPIILPAGLFTLREAGGGFLIGCTLGVAVALATARWTVISAGLMPFAIAVNATPIIALAPIMNNWFGITNPLAKMSIVAVIIFFPVMINTVRGLTLVDAGALELLRSYAAGDFTVLTQLRLPNALPFMFSAFKVAGTLSVIGAIVSEYFGGSRQALGIYISQQAALFHFAEAWAAIVVACGLGLAFYIVILLAERWLMPWHASQRAGDD